MLANIAALLMIASCAPDSESSVPNPGNPEGVHLAREDFIVGCMNDLGFAYEPVAYVEQRSTGNPVAGFLDLKFADEVGYGAVRSALVISLAPRGEPIGLTERSQIEAYDVALSGPGVLDETSDAGHASDSSDLGCRGLASLEVPDDEVVAQFVESYNEEAVSQFYESLLASSEFADFEQAWAECMRSKSYDPGPGVIDFFSEQDSTFLDETWAEVDSLDLTKADGSDLGFGRVISDSSYDQIFETYPSLRAIFNRELAVASDDQTCRNESWDGRIAKRADELSLEYFGQPYRN